MDIPALLGLRRTKRDAAEKKTTDDRSRYVELLRKGDRLSKAEGDELLLLCDRMNISDERLQSEAAMLKEYAELQAAMKSLPQLSRDAEAIDQEIRTWEARTDTMVAQLQAERQQELAAVVAKRKAIKPLLTDAQAAATRVKEIEAEIHHLLGIEDPKAIAQREAEAQRVRSRQRYLVRHTEAAERLLYNAVSGIGYWMFDRAMEEPHAIAPHMSGCDFIACEELGQTRAELDDLLRQLREQIRDPKRVAYLVENKGYGAGLVPDVGNPQRFSFEELIARKGRFDPSGIVFLTWPGQSAKELRKLVEELRELHMKYATKRDAKEIEVVM
jgi:hypothetical protein